MWIQHSAPISPGSSGGALISSRGELLGINSWFVRESQGLNFAVPASTLASAYSGARALQGFLRFPGSPPVSQAQAPSPAGPPQDRSYPAPPPPAMPEPPPPPKAAQRPEDIVLRKARESSAAFLESLPNYVWQESMARYTSSSGPKFWQPTDVVSAELVHENGRERYRNVSTNGRPTQRGIEELPGSWFTKTPGTMVADVFSPNTAADFEYRKESRSGGRASWVYDFSVEREHSHWRIMAASQLITPPYQGSIWIDKETNGVLRIEMQATHMPEAFPFDKAESAMDYEFVWLGDRQFLVPVHGETLSCERRTGNCERNAADFRNYRKYSDEATAGPPPGQNPPTSERLVRLNVTVSDKSGHRITNLPQSAFTVLENGAPQQIKSGRAGSSHRRQLLRHNPQRRGQQSWHDLRNHAGGRSDHAAHLLLD